MQAQDDFSFASTDSSANQSMTTTTRAYKPAGLPTNRPSTLSRSSSRIASLPEATPKFRMKSVMERKTARVVSMPVPSLQDTSSDSIDMADPFISEGEERTRIRVRSQATDVPHTPSAPSSPESVVIIANNSNQLSNDFLRRRVDDESSPESEDEGTCMHIVRRISRNTLYRMDYLDQVSSAPHPGAPRTIVVTLRTLSFV